MKAYTFNSFMCLLFIFMGTLIGAGLYLVGQNPAMGASLVKAIENDLSAFSKIGVSLVLFCLFLFIVFYTMNKKLVYQVDLGRDLSVSVNKKIINEFITEFFESEIPNKKIDFMLKMSRKNLEIIADFSHLSLKDHEKVLKSKMPKLSKQLVKSFGLSTNVKLSLFCKKA